MKLCRQRRLRTNLVWDCLGVRPSSGAATFEARASRNNRTLLRPRTGALRRSGKQRSRILSTAPLSHFFPRDLYRSAAFTLVELVISAAVMSLILAGAYLCLNSGVVSQKLIHSRSDVVQSARVALSMMAADLRSACPVFKGPPFLGMNRMLGEMEADNLDFATHNYTPKSRAQADYCEVSYFVSKDPLSGHWSLWRRRDPTPDDEPLMGGSREELVRGVRGLRFEYYDGFEWFDDWGDPEGKGKAANSQRQQFNLEGMPDAVRITLWIEPSIKPVATATNSVNAGEEPMMFQTVARLNLAPVNRSNTGSNDEQDNASQAAPQPQTGGNE